MCLYNFHVFCGLFFCVGVTAFFVQSNFALIKAFLLSQLGINLVLFSMSLILRILIIVLPFRSVPVPIVDLPSVQIRTPHKLAGPRGSTFPTSRHVNQRYDKIHIVSRSV